MTPYNARDQNGSLFTKSLYGLHEMERFAVSKVHPSERTPPPSDESLLRAFQYTTKRSLTPKVQTMDLVLIFEGSDKKMVLPTNNISSMELI